MKRTVPIKATPKSIVPCIVASLSEEMFVGRWDTICRAAHHIWSGDSKRPATNALATVAAISLRMWGVKKFGHFWQSKLCKLWLAQQLGTRETIEIVNEGVARIARDAERFPMIAQENRWLLDTEDVLLERSGNPLNRGKGMVSSSTQNANWRPIEGVLFGDPDEARERLGHLLFTTLYQRIDRIKGNSNNHSRVDLDGPIDEAHWRWKVHQETDREAELWHSIREFVERMEKHTGDRFGFVQWKLWMANRLGHAWLLKDAHFFGRHSEMWRAACEYSGARKGRPKDSEIKRDYRIQETAWKLRETHGRDPTKKEVRLEIEQLGIRIESRDWPKIWKRCRLAFLQGESGGRPRKHRMKADA